MNTTRRRILSIGILADHFGLSPQTLRVWESQGRISPALRTAGGHRRYTKTHVRAIARLLGAPSPVKQA